MQHTIVIIQTVLTCLLLIAVFLPAVKSNYWIFRVFEYPRFQIWLMTLVLLTSWIFTFGAAETAKFWPLLLLGSFVYLTYKIWPYTWLSPRQMKSTKGREKDNQIRVYTANVYQDNQAYERILAQIRKYDPDIVLLLETDQRWKTQMDSLLDGYPHYIGQPQDNTYGMLLYSRLKIEKGAIRFLVEADIPSLEVTLVLPSGQQVNIWGVHPKPPVPGEAEDADAKDKEIMQVAFKAAASRLPAIVMGDFNDVAWSKVTDLFQKTSQLLDPRRGRGFYSTFSAHSRLVRFPLDYIFCSKHFGLIHMRRLPKNGSDHFAIFTHLEYQPALKHVQSTPATTAGEQQEARKKATAD